MQCLLEPKLFEGLSVYQDVVLDGRVVKPGVRDCEERWRLIEPHFPRAGSVLDVGSNFGWFGLRICEALPDCVVASVEADERSAAVQRRVLASHAHRRICLLTGRAGAAQVRRFARAGQRFDAVLCLSVLHWLPDHREFLTALGSISARLFIEQPDPREEGAGIERIRRQIGPIEDCLAAVLPGRPLVRLGQVTAHRTAEYPRELWLVDKPAAWPDEPSPGLEVSALLDSGVSWPPRSWWLELVKKSKSGLYQSEGNERSESFALIRTALATHTRTHSSTLLKESRGR
ncbi:MAG: class I SAM-dependent methyltransferase, partial [Pirellulales bacterium]